MRINMQLIDELYALGSLKFGSFVLKSGITSPFYIDLRLAISSPKLLVLFSEAIRKAVAGCSYDLICGVPYTALPFATAFSIRHSIPMVMKRKEKKEHGTGKMVEGIFKKGQTCLVIEDVITTGRSVLETIAALESEGLIIQDVAALIDRQQGSRQLLASKGYRLHSVLAIDSIAETLAKNGKIDGTTAATIQDFVRNHQIG